MIIQTDSTEHVVCYGNIVYVSCTLILIIGFIKPIFYKSTDGGLPTVATLSITKMKICEWFSEKVTSKKALGRNNRDLEAAERKKENDVGLLRKLATSSGPGRKTIETLSKGDL